MTAISPFPLFKLPSVARDDVLKSMSLRELVPLSVVSKKTKKIVKSFVKNKSYELNISLNEKNFEVDLSCTNGETLKFIIGAANPDDVPTSCLMVRNKKFKPLLFNLHYVFNMEVTLDLDSQDESLVTYVLDVIKKLDIKMKEARIDGSDQSDNMFQKFLEVSSERLELQAYARSSNFQYDPSHGPMEFDSLFIYAPRWAKFEYFLNCKSVIMMLTELKVHDLVQFLKKWMTSNFPLQFFRVQMNCTDFSSIGNQLSLTEIKKFDTRDNGFQEFEDGHCFGVQRTDGKKAIIYRYFYNATFEIVP